MCILRLALPLARLEHHESRFSYSFLLLPYRECEGCLYISLLLSSCFIFLFNSREETETKATKAENAARPPRKRSFRAEKKKDDFHCLFLFAQNVYVSSLDGFVGK